MLSADVLRSAQRTGVPLTEEGFRDDGEPDE